MASLIGQRIRILRERKGWTQTELAKALGISPQSVQQWEDPNPDVQVSPRNRRLTHVADVLGVTVPDLVDQEKTRSDSRDYVYCGGLSDRERYAVNMLVNALRLGKDDEDDEDEEMTIFTPDLRNQIKHKRGAPGKRRSSGKGG